MSRLSELAKQTYLSYHEKGTHDALLEAVKQIERWYIMSVSSYKDWREALEKNKANGIPYITLPIEDFQHLLDEAEKHADCPKHTERDRSEFYG